MAEDFIGGTSAIELWAGAYGSDPDATLRVDYSTDKGSSWTELDSFTVYKGILQQFILEIPLEGNARFRIVQTAGTRVNIDDITIYGRKQQEPIIPGDVNHDGEVNIADINATLDIILSGSNNHDGDVNSDNEINIADINAVIDIILGS
jgi:hypothetical protein